MLTTFAGRVGDHNDLAMPAALRLGDCLAERWGCAQQRVGGPKAALDADWRTELAAAIDVLGQLAVAVAPAEPVGPVGPPEPAPQGWLTVMPRCAGALATLPVVCRLRPDVCVLWLDAHADLHLPSTTTSGYLGGMALSGPLGWWNSGLGDGVDGVVLAGTRDIDPGEQRLVDEHGIAVVAPGAGFAERLAEAVAGRPVYVHLDCDVLEPGVVPTDYRVPGGLDLATLHSAAEHLSTLDVAGLEIAELEDHPDGAAAELDPLLDALAPLVDLLAGA